MNVIGRIYALTTYVIFYYCRGITNAHSLMLHKGEPMSNGSWVWAWVMRTRCFPVLSGGLRGNHTCFSLSSKLNWKEPKLNMPMHIRRRQRRDRVTCLWSRRNSPLETQQWPTTTASSALNSPSWPPSGGHDTTSCNQWEVWLGFGHVLTNRSSSWAQS